VSSERTSGRTLSERGFRDEVSALTERLRRTIEAKVGGFAIDPDAKAKRLDAIKDPLTGFRIFAETYFPHYLTAPPNLLHLHLFQHLPAIAHRSTAGQGPDKRRGAREVIISPRGSAKSTFVSQIFPLYCVCLGLRRYIIIAMDTFEQAALMLEAIKVELTDNPRLREDFPHATGGGPTWREGLVVTSNGIRIDAVGARQKLRGRRHGPHRPDLVVLDDIENDENVRSPEYRDKLESWVMKAVLKLGPADGSLDVLVVGTLLHFDAVLKRLADKPTWQSNSFKALVRLPEQMDLWERWEEILRNEGEKASDQYFEARRDSMQSGAIVNWPELQPLHFLMKERAESPSAFASEYQNEPISENAPFRDITFWVTRQPNLVLFGAIDPSLGKRGAHRDPSAIIIGGFDKATGRLDVLEASIRRRLPDLIIADALAMAREYQPALWFVEAVQFQEFLRTELMNRAVKAGIALPAIPVIPNTDKRLRIERLQPPMAAGLIRLHSSQSTLLEQLQQWPSAAHDDGPDALEMLWSGAVQYGGGISGGSIGIGAKRGSNGMGSRMQGFRL
jgi:predicted phage terminase large subunit-like protein